MPGNDSRPTTREAALAVGMTRYWPPEPCRNGHVGAWRNANNGACSACKNEAAQRFLARQRGEQDAEGQRARGRMRPPLSPEAQPFPGASSALHEQGFAFKTSFHLDPKGKPTLAATDGKGLYCMVVDGVPMHVGLTQKSWARRWGNYRGNYDSANARIRGWLIHALTSGKTVELWMREGEDNHASEIAARAALGASAWNGAESPTVQGSFESAVARAVYGLKAKAIREDNPTELRARLQAVLDLLPQPDLK